MLPKQFLLLLAFLLATAEEIQEDPVTLLRRNEQPEIVYHGAELYEEKQETNYPCLGCPFDLNPDAEGVSTLVDTALRHVESERDEKHALVRVLRLQQQVVAGIKYLLLVEIAPTTCSKDTTISFCPIDQSKGSYICEIEYFEQPWLNSGKNIIRNNCTLSQEYLPKEPEKPIRRKEQEERPDFLSELESQIIPDSSFVNPDNNRYVYSVNEIEEPLNNPDFMTPNFVFKDSYPAYDVQELASPKEEMRNFIAKDINSSDNKKGDDSDASSGSNEDDEKNYSIRKRSLTNEGGKSDTSESLDDSKSFNDSIDSNSSENKKKNNIRKRNVNINGGKSDTSESLDDSIDSNSSEKKKKNNIRKRNVNDNGGKSDTSEESKSSKSSKDATNSESSNSSENRHRKKDNGNDVPHVEFQRKRSIGDLDNLTEDEQILLLKFSKKTLQVMDMAIRRSLSTTWTRQNRWSILQRRVTLINFAGKDLHSHCAYRDDLSNPSLVRVAAVLKELWGNNIPGGIVTKR
ncbi:hypothetical protein JTB14_038202 [Gonioctena quinquepunctata]|nr:hypothetical protein JTB14_038202 [Gonioctena quinquepunctata]